MNQPAKAAQAPKAQEPSMEEILASIRRIIADDDGAPAAAPEPAAKAAPAPVKAAPPPPKAPEPPKPVAKAPPPAPPKAPEPAPADANSQDDIDAMFASFDTVDDTPAEPPAAGEDVFELTESMAVETPPTQFRKIQPDDDVEFTEMGQRAAEPAPEPPSRAAAGELPLVSTTTISAVNSAFNALASTVLSNNARTLEDLVKEMLRPMLKSWLDDNLPGVVERLVKAEIERVARGR